MKKSKIVAVVVCAVFMLTLVLLPATAAKKKVNLSMWTFVSRHNIFYTDQAERFAKEHPEYDFKLTIESYPWAEMHDKLLISLMAGVGAPDLVDVEIAPFGRFFKDIHFVDLTDLVEKYRDVIVWSRVLPYSYEGKVYGVPTHLGSWMMYYNKEVFEKVGIDIETTDEHYNPLSIKTWDDFISVGKKVTKDFDGDGRIDQWMTSVENNSRIIPMGLSLQREVGWIDEDGRPLMDDPRNIEVMQFLGDLVHKYEIACIAPGGNFHEPTFYPYMNEGHIAGFPFPQWYMMRFTEFMPDLKGKMVMRPLPRWEEGGNRSAMGGGTGTVITDQCEDIEVAKEYLEYSKLSKDASIRIWTELEFDPFRHDVYSEPELDEPLPYWNNERVFRVIKEIVPEIFAQRVATYWPEMMDFLHAEIIYPIIEKGESAKEVIEKQTPIFMKKIDLE